MEILPHIGWCPNLSTIQTGCLRSSMMGPRNEMVFGIHEGRVDFSHIHGVGLDHLQLFFRELPVVDVRGC